MIDIVDKVYTAVFDFFTNFVSTDLFMIFVFSGVICLCVWRFVRFPGEGSNRRHSSDPTLLWLWRRLAAVSPIGPLAWEPPCATDVALKSKTIVIIK